MLSAEQPRNPPFSAENGGFRVCSREKLAGN